MRGGKRGASIILQLPGRCLLSGLVVFGVKIGQLRILTAPSSAKTLLGAAGSLLRRGMATRIGVKRKSPGLPYLDARAQRVAGELETNLVVALKRKWQC